ncbi:hypothetical protein DWB77_02753 [Streptomyces hundungensis]|uniref:Uncharacterized protein n=1 Tax=Streptomyces hundungensis TaxID=1077946 RepID=A0A387H9U9_9ACTN|nr:hypothetical protein DWB77_02753 [Streptomyces hundungensis]
MRGGRDAVARAGRARPPGRARKVVRAGCEERGYGDGVPGVRRGGLSLPGYGQVVPPAPGTGKAPVARRVISP